MEPRLTYNPNEKKFINLEIAPQEQTGRAEVLMFISDVDELYSETICFQINFIQNLDIVSIHTF